MSRAWTDNANSDGTRKHSRGVHGTDKETVELVRKGFDPVTSENGDSYYYSPARGLIWLFPDNTWFGERIQARVSLDEYLSTIPDLEIEERLFRVVQTEGGVANNLGTMNGVELTAYVANRIGNEVKAATMLSELAKKDSIKIEYSGAFGAAVSIDIHRLLFKPSATVEMWPRKGDTFVNGWTVDYTAEGVVWIVGRPNSPIPLTNVAAANQPGVWKLVGISSTEDEGVS